MAGFILGVAMAYLGLSAAMNESGQGAILFSNLMILKSCQYCTIWNREYLAGLARTVDNVVHF